MKDKYLKIMADYSSSGLWDREGKMIDIEDVPELPFWWVPRFKEWTEKYEDNDDWMEDSDGDFPYEKFSADGRVLAQKLANVLKDWEIWYFDEAASHKCYGTTVQDDPSIYLHRIEHE
jgi:hypothetical protein